MATSNLLPETAALPGKVHGPVVEFQNVSIGFDGKPVLDDVSFSAYTGETRIILGPAGCGKSVLLKLANGLLRPDSGHIYAFGEEVTALTETELFHLRRRTGMVFQESALFDSLTVRENVAYQLIEDHVEEETITARVLEVLQFVELEHTIDMFPSQLSGGMKRRVAIARAILTQPKLLLYDSPTGGLDPITSTTIIELIVKQRDVYESTALLVTHRLQDAYTLATHRWDHESNQMQRIPNNGLDPKTTFLVLDATRVLFNGTLPEMVHSNDPFLKEFLA
jgi:phospholipid/cholesterol/gamma-HCH transport system ATP-binding protein